MLSKLGKKDLLGECLLSICLTKMPVRFSVCLEREVFISKGDINIANISQCQLRKTNRLFSCFDILHFLYVLKVILSYGSVFLSSANKVIIGPTCQKVCVCLSVFPVIL